MERGEGRRLEGGALKQVFQNHAFYFGYKCEPMPFLASQWYQKTRLQDQFLICMKIDDENNRILLCKRAFPSFLEDVPSKKFLQISKTTEAFELLSSKANISTFHISRCSL